MLHFVVTFTLGGTGATHANWFRMQRRKSSHKAPLRATRIAKDAAASPTVVLANKERKCALAGAASVLFRIRDPPERQYKKRVVAVRSDVSPTRIFCFSNKTAKEKRLGERGGQHKGSKD